MKLTAVVSVVALSLAVKAGAQSVTLSEKSGRPLTVGENAVLAQNIEVTRLLTASIVSEFAQLCLPDPLGAATRTSASAFAFSSADVIFPADGKRPEIRVANWSASNARMAVVSGDDPNMRGLPIVIDERAYQVTGAYGPFRADGAQCNFVIRLPGFAEVKALGEALAAKFGPQGKLVVKNTFADGHWQSGNLRINFTAPTSQGSSQPVHLSVQSTVKKGN